MRMNLTIAHLPLALLACGLLPSQAQAQDWSKSSMDLKFRVGSTFGAIRDDMKDNKSLGFGLAGNIALGDGKAITVELGYDTIPGRSWDTTQYPGTVYYVLNGKTITSYANGDPNTPGATSPLQLIPNNSAESKKRKIEGFSLRGAYVNAIDSQWAWQAGLSLDFYKSTSELVGSLTPDYLAYNTGTKTWGYTRLGANEYEGWALSEQRSKLQLGAYAGVIWALSRNHKLEMNLRNVGYGVKDYTPFAYTGQTAHLSDKNGRGTLIEFALTVKM